MSKLAERIRRATRIESAPIGFGAITARRKELTLLVAVQLPLEQNERLNEANFQGIDTAIFGPVKGKLDTTALANGIKAAGEIPCGVWIDDAIEDDITKVSEVGADYVVVSLDTPAVSMLDDKLGYVLAIQEELPDTTLRMLEGLSLDAALVEPDSGLVTLRSHLELRRTASLARAPLFVRLEGEPDSKALEVLRDAGAVALLLDGSRQEALSFLPKLRQMIEDLPPPRRRRREERMEASLPTVVAPSLAPHEEEEEEDDE